jgi:hypothetical protein
VKQWLVNSNRLLNVCDLFYNYLPLLNLFLLELHDCERQLTELRKKADDERVKKEAVSIILKKDWN